MLYYCRGFLILIYFVFFAILATFIALLSPFNPDNSSRILKFFKPAYWLGNIKVVAINPIAQPKKPVVYIANHQDLMDIFMFSQVWPKNTVVIGKRSLLLIPFFGTAFWLSGNILINRKNKSSSWKLMDHLADNIHLTNHSIFFMPEGTRSQGKGLLPFKQGAFSVAIKAGVDIIPVCASNTSYIDLHERSPKTGFVEFLPPISTRGLNNNDVQALADHCYHLMAEKIKLLNKRVNTLAV